MLQFFLFLHLIHVLPTYASLVLNTCFTYLCSLYAVLLSSLILVHLCAAFPLILVSLIYAATINYLYKP